MPGPEDTEIQTAFVGAIMNHASALITAVEFIAENLEPGDVFTDEKLLAWAKARGFQPLPKDEE